MEYLEKRDPSTSHYAELFDGQELARSEDAFRYAGERAALDGVLLLLFNDVRECRWWLDGYLSVAMISSNGNINAKGQRAALRIILKRDFKQLPNHVRIIQQCFNDYGWNFKIGQFIKNRDWQIKPEVLAGLAQKAGQ